jgi:erythromycin esterase-like protein
VLTLFERDITPNWEGHKPATSAELLTVLITATTGSARLSRADRVLFTVCEFWASARNRTLLTQLADDAVSQLQAAEIAFAAIGLPNAGRIVRRARKGLAEFDALALPQVVCNLERALVDNYESVDEVIAGFADQQAQGRIDRQLTSVP